MKAFRWLRIAGCATALAIAVVGAASTARADDTPSIAVASLSQSGGNAISQSTPRLDLAAESRQAFCSGWISACKAECDAWSQGYTLSGCKSDCDGRYYQQCLGSGCYWLRAGIQCQ